MLQYPLQLPPLSPVISVPGGGTANGSTPSSASSGSYAIEDVLAPGDIVGEGCALRGEPIHLVSISSQFKPGDDLNGGELARECEVVRRLGSGSCAVVYLVKEVLSRSPPSEDGHISTMSAMEFDGDVPRGSETVYGREYAIKCLPKANFDEEALVAQSAEVLIHQSLRSHPNIVTLHRTLQTSSFLLLLLEYVPGEDLFYFLEEARDHYETDTPSPTGAISVPRTPPTPGLLSDLHPSQLLSHARLRLIASMFGQMCDAVAACHAQQVYHRDIKPENFIVTDGWITLPDGRQERKVIVKLTDFGLSTKDVESADMDCGSTPYMSYECRNNVAPTYRPRAADVWSLGIVLINMLYHFNPWTDTSLGTCASFDLFRRDPINFFTYRFTGMTQPVADFLANRVFCILDDSGDDSPRVTADEFGVWVKNLPTLLGGGHDMHRTLSSSSTGHPIAPTSRSPSVSAKPPRTPAVASRPQPLAPPPGPAYEEDELSTVHDQKADDQPQRSEEKKVELIPEEVRAQNEDYTPSMGSTAKRGVQQGKAASAASTTTDETLISLAIASQNLARELSLVSRASPVNSVSTKKPSKWNLSFGKQSAGLFASASGDGLPPSPAPLPELGLSYSQPISATASNVANLIMKLNDPIHNSGADPTNRAGENPSTWARGRTPRGSPTPSKSANESTGYGPLSTSGAWNLGKERSTRAISPLSVRSGHSWRTVASSASSITSGDDRSCYYSCISTTRSLDSWRSGSEGLQLPAGIRSAYPMSPKNVKLMTGVPWEIEPLPPQQFPNPSARKAKDTKLDTIHEQPTGSGGIPKYAHLDAATSTTDLTGDEKGGNGNVKKVQKGQINALAKLLSALRHS